MASSIDNVIRFPDGARGSVADFDRSRMLVEARDLMAHKLREAFRGLLPDVEEALLSRGDVADERDTRQRYYGTKDILHDNAGRLEGLLAANWLRLFEQKGRTDKAKTSNGASDADELQLVEFGAMDEELTVKAIGSRLRDGCEDGLFAAGRRLGFLFGQPDSEAALPIEDLISRALDGAFEDIGLDSAARLEVLRSVEPDAVKHFGPAIHDLNSFLIGRGVLPRLRRSYARSPDARKPQPAAGDQAVDVFNLLQKLVAAQPGAAGGAATLGAGGGSGDLSFGGDAAVAGGGSGAGVPANMVIAMQQVMTSLDALQRAEKDKKDK